MEECESLDSEVTELQEFMSQDDEDEVEELQNSLREVVQDRSVKPKFQCLMVDASFSMVTVQSEDSGIVWETASSRCSTPWASETSSTSEAYSMDGSGAAGKITIVFDENKIVRRRTRSGRSSRLGGSLSRPGSSRSASALGVERPEMAEISLPNVKPDKTETQPDLEEIRNKDQQLFSLISEGYEILNIRVPSKLPTVDEEESTELEDNLSYLDQTPKIRSGNRKDYSLEPNPALAKEGELLDQEPSADTGLREKPSQKESAGDMDYFEKFTLVDVVVPGEQAPELQEDAEQPQAKPEEEEQKPAEEADTNSPSASEDSFVFVTDVDIAGEHLDEVFYGAGAPDDASQQREDEEAESGTTRRRRASHRSLMANGSVLFGAEDTVLTPIFISPGPPKIIDQILLDEPTAMSFMYSDLYEDAVGERRKSDEEHSEAESIASEKTCKRRLSDSDEADGYLEKFILKDETSTVEVQPESVQENREGRMMWSLSEFDMTGCLTRVTTEEDVSKTEDPETKEVSVGDGSDNLQSAPLKGRREIITETEMKDVHVSTVTEGKAVRDASHDPIEAPTLRGNQMGDQGVKHEVKVEAPESSIDEPLNEAQKVDGKVEKAEESAQRPIEVLAETKQPCDTTVVLDAAGETDVAAPVSGEAAHITEISLSKEADEDTETMAAKDKDVTEAVAEASDGVKQMETSAKTSLWEENKAAEVVPGDALLFEVITECDSAVQALVEVIGKTVDETEIQTEVLIDLQEAISVDTTAEEEEKPGVLAEGAAVEGTLPEFITEGYQETEVKAAITSEVTEPAMLDEIKKESDIAQILNSGSMQHQQEEPVTDSELTNKAEDKTPTEDTANVTQEKVNVNDELVLLVPKGQAVEMDIEISQLSRKTPSDPEALYEPDRLTAPETPPACSETPQGPTEPTTTQPRLAVTPDQDTLSRYPADTGSTPPAAEQETYADTLEARSDFEEVEGDFLTLRSLTPQEDLSGSHSEDMKSGEADAEQKAEIHYEGDAPEASKPSTEIDVHREDVEPQMEHDPTAAEASEMTADGLEYEIISKQDAERMPEAETQRAVEEPILESGQERDERMEMQMEIEEEEEEEEEKVLDDELTEADYEIIDAEEESQARLADELRQMVRFCVTCGCLLSEDDCVSGEHQGHEVAAVDEAYKEIKEKLSDWISELQERSENIEDLVSELELAYNSVEDQCLESEAAMQAQNEEMKAVVMEQYNDMSVSMEEEKKAKLEQLYDQIVALQESIDAAKVTLETTAREAETDARTPEDINARIKATLDSAMSLELGPKGLLVFEDYVRGNGSSSHLLSQRKGIPVPQRPTLLPQESGLATSTSVTVYWRVNPGDIIDCFQVYCMEDPQGAVSEEYRVTVKESYCALEELEPDKTYKVWVMAVNYTGCSLPSERLSFRTAPAVPVIETERCTVLWDSATLRWSSASQTPEQSYTLEYCRQYELEGEGLRSISGIQSCEQRVLLQPNESYLFYIKAVNECGSSEQSEAALISTKGTRFHLLETSAHPALKLSADRTTVHCDAPPADKQCPSILGELLPARGRYYWEAVVSGSAAYRLGVAYDTANRNSPLGENHLSWCLQCIPTPSGCRYQLLHDHILSTMFVIEVPERVGTLLDYQLGRLSFYNARSGQLLGAFCQRFARPCHAALALETPGSLEVSLLPEAPEFTKDS